jgi:hypothetical protein
MVDVRYPTADRSDFTPNFVKKDFDDQLDIGFAEGIFSDGRPFRAEFWAANQISFLTYYFSSADIESFSDGDLRAYLETEHSIDFQDEKFVSSGFEGINIDASKAFDASGNEIWEVTIIVGDEDGTYMRNGVVLKRYKK